MTDQTPINVPSQAVAVREPEAVNLHGMEGRPATTSAQAKIDAVASVTMAAYAKASQLVLTGEEVAALKADFPDEAFKPGAAGKENLLYCEHAFLRDRLDTALGMGQWTLVPRNRWAEPFKTNAGKDGSRVYFEGMLMVRGCFVAEAIGEMEYYPHNAAQNYGDAVEGAESACLRRCCKKWGIGLQAWKKDWCEGWWKRRKGQGAAGPTPFTKTAPTPHATPHATPKTPPVAPAAKPATTAEVLPPKEASTATRTWALGQLRSQFPDDVLLPYFMEHSFILPENEKLEDWGLGHVPTSRPACTELIAKVGEWQRKKLPPNSDMEAGDEWFWEIVVPVPHKGQKRDEYLKDPDTIASLYGARHENEDARSRLFGFLSYYEPKGWTNREGKEMPPNATDLKFREALDEFGKWFQAAHPEEQRD